MPLPLELAHRRFVQQAGWTAQLRRRLLSGAGLANAARVLEVGCGTGAILGAMPISRRRKLFGFDLDREALRTAKWQASAALLSAGNAAKLPFAGGAFDITFTHFLLMWLQRPLDALREMRRVTRRGGAVLALAEPDYSQRFDYPPKLDPLGRLQTEALRAHGANPEIGSQLDVLFRQAGFASIESGKLDAPITIGAYDWELETEVLRADLAGRVETTKLQGLLAADEQAWRAGSRMLHIPTHFAWGRVP